MAPALSLTPWESRLQQRWRPVYNDADMRRAIGDVAVRTTASGDGSTFGSQLLIVGTLLPATPYVIPATCGGLSIAAAGRIPIQPIALLASLFTLRARAVTFADLLVAAGSNGAGASVFLLTDTDSAQHTTVDSCIINADTFISDAGGKLNNSAFTKNTIAPLTAAAVPVVSSASARCRYHGNNHGGSTASKELLLVGAATDWSVGGNNFNGRGVDTSVGTRSSVANNTNCGGVVIAGGDIAGLNT
jgi:hypothetical protein